MIIPHKFTGKVLFELEADNIKICLEAGIKAGANLRGADLGGANLRGADLGEADLGEADLGEADLGEAELWGANLRGAELWGAELGGANLGGAELRGAKNYKNSHDIFIEITRRQKDGFFTDVEWSIIGKIAVKRICWPDIRKFGKDAFDGLKKIAELGFGEYLEKFEKGEN